MHLIDIIRNPDILQVQAGEEFVEIKMDGKGEWNFKDVQIEIQNLNNQLNIYLFADGTPVKRVIMKWKGKIETDSRILGDHWERGYGDLEWRGIVPDRIMPWYFITTKNSTTCCYGVKTAPKAICFWQIDGNYITLCMDVRCGGYGVNLNGRRLNAATIISYKGKEEESTFITSKKFCSQLCDKPRLPSIPVYGGNNWYYAYGKSSHKEITEDSKFISELAISNNNRPFMVIDDGWQKSHCGDYNGGPWNAGNDKFNDMQKLALQMKEIGTKPGIWMRPLFTNDKAYESMTMPNKRFMENINGMFMDPSEPEVLSKISEDIKNIVSWGYDLIKHDFSTFDILGRWGIRMGDQITCDGWSFKNTSKTTAEIILELYNTIRRAAGDTLVIGCNTISHLSAGIFEIQRTGDDTSGKEWERTRKMGINTLAFRMMQNETFYACDADCAGITRDIPWSLNKQWLDLLAKSGTPLFISADPKAMGSEQKKAIKEAFDIAAKVNTSAEPLDWTWTTCPQKWLINGTVNEFDW